MRIGMAVSCALVLLGVFAGSARAASDGTLEVKTQPDGVEVWLDDKYIGDSPIFDKKLKPGRYTLKLVDPVQKTSLIEELFIQDGQKTVVEKTITAKFGTLRVDSDPQGAEVIIATSLGKTPLTNDLMNPGKYRLEIRHPNKNYTSASEEVTVGRSQTVNVNKTLEYKSPFTNKTLLRLGLGAASIVAFTWAVIEQGNHMKFEQRALNDADPRQQHYKDLARSAGGSRTLGIILGSACVVGVEIVAFF